MQFVISLFSMAKCKMPRGVRQELVDTKSQLARLKLAIINNFHGESGDPVYVDKSKMTTVLQLGQGQPAGTPDSCEQWLNSIKQATVEHVLKSKMAFKNSPASLVEAERVMNTMGLTNDDAVFELQNLVYHRTSVSRFTMYLDQALDLMFKERVEKDVYHMHICILRLPRYEITPKRSSKTSS